MLRFCLLLSALAALPAHAAQQSCPDGITDFESPLLTVERGPYALRVTLGHGEEALSYYKIGTIQGEPFMVMIPAVVFGGSPDCTVVVGADQWPTTTLESAIAEWDEITLVGVVAPRAVTGVALGRPGQDPALAGQEGEDIVMSGTLPHGERIVITDTSAGFWLGGGERRIAVGSYQLTNVQVSNW